MWLPQVVVTIVRGGLQKGFLSMKKTETPKAPKTPKAPVKDKRRHSRFDVEITAHGVAPACEFSGAIKNMSLGGALIELVDTSKIQVGDCIGLELFVKSAESSWQSKVPAVVQRTDEHGVGVKFSVSRMPVETFLFVKMVVFMLCDSDEAVQRLLCEYRDTLNEEELKLWSKG